MLLYNGLRLTHIYGNADIKRNSESLNDFRSFLCFTYLFKRCVRDAPLYLLYSPYNQLFKLNLKGILYKFCTLLIESPLKF